MQYVFIDTNIFYNNWFLNSPNFIFLFNYLHLTGARLLISELAIEEVDNLFKRELESATSELSKSLKKHATFFEKEFKTKFVTTVKDYSFKKVLEKKPAACIYFNYNLIPHTEVVNRAIKQIMPFRENEKGYRDTLIWLSLIQWLDKNGIADEVVFINNNSSDYYDGQNASFHPDLKQDISKTKLGCAITPYLSLTAFIASIKDSEGEQKLKEQLQDFLDEQDDKISEQVEKHLKTITISSLQIFLKEQGIKLPYVDTILDFDFLVIEGMEDPTMLSYKNVSLNSVLVTYQFDFRNCELLIGIPEADYLRRKSEIDSYYVDIYMAEDSYAYFSRFVRPTFQVNFIFDFNKSRIESFEILSMKINFK